MATTYASRIMWSRGQQRNVGPLEAAVLGGAAHAFIFTVAAPLNRVQVLLRVEPELRDRETQMPVFDGGIDCCKKIRKKDGWMGFFLGNMVAVLRWIPIQFTEYVAETWLGQMLRPSDSAPFFARAFGNIFRQRLVRFHYESCFIFS